MVEERKKRFLGIMFMAALLSWLIFLPAGASGGEPLFVGEWKGAIQLPGQELGIEVTLKWEEGEYQGTIDIPLQGAVDIPLESFLVEDQELAFDLKGIPGDPRIEVTLSHDHSQLQGKFYQAQAAFPVILERETQEEMEVKEEKALVTWEEQEEEIIAAIEKLLEEWTVPGAAVGIKKDGKLLLAQGFGYAQVEEEMPVTPETRFAIGSSTKAFTTAAVALMVEEGKLSWDQPVVNILPWFRLHDDYASRLVTLRDFALHRSGLSRHDFSWYGREIDREEIIASMEYLELAAPIRETFIYNNHGYTLLGYLAGKAAGMEWEELLKERFFIPLGMENTGMTIQGLKEVENHARPYQSRGGELLLMGYRDLDTMGPAGSIYSNVMDMLTWVQIFLQEGQHQKEEILSPQSVAQLTQPQMALPAPGFQEMQFSNYALGWMVDDYQGDVLVHHGGNIDGYTALVAMVPREDLGIVVLTNMNNSSLPVLAVYQILDILAGREPVNWSGRIHESQSMLPDDLLQPPRQIEGTQPSRDLQEYAGYYENPGYGQIQVGWLEEEGRLEFIFRDKRALLKHWHYDVFTARIPGMAVGLNLPVHFISNLDGFITSLSVPLDPSVGSIVFALTAGPELMEVSYLESFQGQYEVMGIELTIWVQGEKLWMDIPGQPAYQLIPQRPGRFLLKDLEGFSVDFLEEEGEITGLWLNQPHGPFQAQRVQ